MKTQLHAPLAVGASDVTELARQCRERALAAREAATELSPEQAAAVGGGLLIDGPFPWGVLPYLRLADMFTSPATDGALTKDIAAGQSF